MHQVIESNTTSMRQIHWKVVFEMYWYSFPYICIFINWVHWWKVQKFCMVYCKLDTLALRFLLLQSFRIWSKLKFFLFYPKLAKSLEVLNSSKLKSFTMKDLEKLTIFQYCVGLWYQFFFFKKVILHISFYILWKKICYD